MILSDYSIDEHGDVAGFHHLTIFIDRAAKDDVVPRLVSIDQRVPEPRPRGEGVLELRW